MPFVTLNDALAGDLAQYVVFVEVEQLDGTWLDLSRRLGTGSDRLIGMPGFTSTLEKELGQTETTTDDITLDNDDGYFTGPAPASLGSWVRRRVRVSIESQGVRSIRFTGIILSVKRSAAAKTATFTTSSLLKILRDKDASVVRNGKRPFRYRTVAYLLRECLYKVHTKADVDQWDADGLLLGAYEIPLADPTTRAPSAHSILPGQMNTGVWRDDQPTIYGSPMCAVNDAAAPNGLDGKIVYALGGDLYVRDPAATVQQSTYLYGFAALGGGTASLKVRHLWWDVTLHAFVGVAWDDDLPSATSTAKRHRSGVLNGVVKFFHGDGAVGASSLTLYSDASLGNGANGTAAYHWSGHFTIYPGGYSSIDNVTSMGANTDGAQTATKSWGPNFPLPHGQWLRLQTAVGSSPKNLQGGRRTGIGPGGGLRGDSLHDVTTMTDTYGVEFASGYISWTQTGDARPLDYCVNLGQRAGAYALATNGGTLAFASIELDATGKTYRFKLWTLNTSTGAYTSRGFITGGGLDIQPYCLSYRRDDARLMVAGTVWPIHQWSGGFGSSNRDDTKCIMARYDVPTYALTTSIDITSAGGRVPLEIVYTGGTNTSGTPLLVGLFCEPYADVDAQVLNYRATTFSEGGGNYSVSTRVSLASNQPMGLVLDVDAGFVYYVESGFNRVLQQGISNNTAPPGLASPFSATDSDLAVQAGLVWCHAQSALYWISAPGQNVQADPSLTPPGQLLAGEYRFCQFKNALTDVVPLFDVNGRKLLDCVGELAVRVDALYRYTEVGAFTFLPRPIVAAPVGIITRDGVQTYGPVDKIIFLVDDLEVDSGHEKIGNVIEIPASRFVRAQPTGTGRAVPRPDTLGRGDQWKGTLNFTSSNDWTQHVSLRCVAGSALGAADNGLLDKDASGRECVDIVSDFTTQRWAALRFAFLSDQSTIESQILSALTPATVSVLVPVQHAVDVVAGPLGYGDTFTIDTLDATGNPLTVVRTITAKADDYQNGWSTLTLDSGIGQTTTLALGTRCILSTFLSSEWSDGDRGVTTLASALGSGAANFTVTVVSATPIARYSVIRIDAEEMRVVDIVGNTLTVVRSINNTDTNASHAFGAVVKCYVAPLINTVGYAIAGGPSDAAAFTSATVFGIGGTGVGLSFIPDALQVFALGDTLDIDCPGLTALQDDSSKIVLRHPASIAKWGEIPLTVSRSFRLCDRTVGTVLGNRLLLDNAGPHFTATAIGSMRGLPDVGSTWQVLDSDMLPRVGGGNPNGRTAPYPLPDSATAIGVVINSVRMQPQSDAITVATRAVYENVE